MTILGHIPLRFWDWNLDRADLIHTHYVYIDLLRYITSCSVIMILIMVMVTVVAAPDPQNDGHLVTDDEEKMFIKN